MVSRLATCLAIGLLLPAPSPAGALTVKQAISKYGSDARKKLAPSFDQAQVRYPPKEMTWIGLKEEKELLIFARDVNGKIVQVKHYPIFGTSGTAGPKLKEGDRQIPEGFYDLTALQPNSVAHLALCINYPNDFDRANAKMDKRTNLGGDIEIHGSFWSTGCLAMGNDAIEELFVLAHDVGLDKIKLILAPNNFNCKTPTIDPANQPKWLPQLYRDLKQSMSSYPIRLDPLWLKDVYSDLEHTLQADDGNSSKGK